MTATGDLAQRLASMLDVMAEGLQLLDFDYRYIYVNETAASHGRRPRAELIGSSMLELYPGIESTDMFRHLARCMTERVSHRMDNEFVFPDGSKEWFELRIDPVAEGVRILSIDVGRRRSLEQQLAHAQKMEAIGQLAGGIAHDFNNLLTVILSYLGFAIEDLPPESPQVPDLKEALGAAQRGAQLTRQLLSLGRSKVMERRFMCPADNVRELVPMFRRVLGERIAMKVAIDPEAGDILADPGQIDQVLTNLVTNARDAIPEGGTVTLRVENVNLDDAYVDEHAEVTPGPHVMIVVSDTGHGMDADTLRRIFEPFFTTKGPEKGTGLGLATSHGIVRQHGGHIWVYSEVGRGTTFKLYFPRALDASVDDAPTLLPVAEDVRGNEVVMVVEDEPSLRALYTRALKQHGYTVIHVESGEEALRFSASYSGAIDAVITDVMMSGITGPQMASELVRTRPATAVLFVSGYAVPGLLDTVRAEQYLEKPFSPVALVRRVRELLNARGATEVKR